MSHQTITGQEGFSGQPSQTELPGITEKKRRSVKFKEEYVKENALQKVQIESLKNQVSELTHQLEKCGDALVDINNRFNQRLELCNKYETELAYYKRSLFARLFGRKGV